MGWLVLLLLGQAASLALTAAGNLVGYQHYRLPPWGPVPFIALAILATQAAAVAFGLRSRWPALRNWSRQNLSPAARLLLLGAIVASSATASKDVAFYVQELMFASLVQLVAIGNVVLLGRAVRVASVGQRLRRWLGESETPGGRIDAFAIGLAGWVLVVASVLALVSYQRHPHVPDEVVYLLHARYLSEGSLTLPLPPAPIAFNIDLMHYDATRWYSPVPPGWPFVLAIGAFAGAPWLVNPVLGALNILLAYMVLGAMYERRVARLAALFLAVSPWFVFMAMNFMTHQLTLFFGLLGAVAVTRLRGDRARLGLVRASTLATTFCGGLAIGGASLVRPLEGLATAFLLGLWSLPSRWWATLRRPAALVPSAVLGAGAVVAALLVRPYNRYMTGDASSFPIMAYIDKYYAKGSNDLGFGANRGLGWSGLDPFPGHGAVDVVVNANLNVTSTNVELLGWATGSLLAIFLLLATRRLRRADWWHVVVIGVIAGVHSLYWFSGGPDFGARYWFLIVVSCVALVARGVVELGATLEAGGEGSGSGPVRATSAALALSLAALLTFFPWRAVDKYHNYRGMRPDIPALASENRFGRSLVFIRGKRHPDYASAVAYNPTNLRANVPLYAWDAGREAREEALRAYADRPVWFVDGPTRTGGRFRVAAGPLTADQARAFSQP